MKKNMFLVIVGLILLSALVSASSWPADASGTELVAGLPSAYEPSGAAWDSESQKLYVVSDEGIVSRMNLDGSSVQNWYFSGDYEGIAVASGKVYIGIEYPAKVVEFDPTTGTLTGKSWTLNHVNGDAKLGMEGMTIVPTNTGLRVYAGSQYDASISVYDINPSVSESVSYVTSFKPYSGSISDLSYDVNTGRLYALYDSAVVVLDLQGNILDQYTAPGFDQEGIAVISSCSSTLGTIVVASDTPASVMKYGNFQTGCVVPVPTVDVNLISSFTVNSDRSISVQYKDGHSNSFTAFSDGKVKAALNKDSTRLIVSNGKYVAVYKNGVNVAQKQINANALKTYTMTVTSTSTGDSILVDYVARWYRYTDTLSLEGDTLSYISGVKTRL